MNATTRGFFLAWVLMIPTTGLGAEFLEVMEQGEEPSHLEPLFHEDTEYQLLVQRKLELTPGECGRVVFRPSFQPEWAVSVHAVEEDAKRGASHQGFQITLTEAESSLYFSLPSNREGKGKKPRPVRVVRRDVDIPKDLAVAVQRAWAAVLRQTRYPDKWYGGCDGEFLEFSVFVRGLGVLQGQTWSPQKGLPAALMKAGVSLADYCRATETQRQKLLLSLQAELQRIEREARSRATDVYPKE